MSTTNTPNLTSMELEQAIDKIHDEDFRRELEQVIKRHSIDAALGTPDFMIRTFIQSALCSLVTLDECRRGWFSDDDEAPR